MNPRLMLLKLSMHISEFTTATSTTGTVPGHDKTPAALHHRRRRFDKNKVSRDKRNRSGEVASSRQMNDGLPERRTSSCNVSHSIGRDPSQARHRIITFVTSWNWTRSDEQREKQPIADR